jgi:SAM-dependent methyltransferase
MPQNVDWNRNWREGWECDERKNTPEFWDRRAKSFGDPNYKDDYSAQFLSIVQPQPDWTVLDVGCGTGALAVPLAPRVAHITAVDFSPAMLDVLKNKCIESSIQNVTAIQGSWDDDWSQLGVGRHDVAIASRSMRVKDPRSAIEKLVQHADKWIFVSDMVGDGPNDRRIFEAVGRELKTRPDYIYTYNILHEMNICANVTLITLNRNRQYASQDDAYESVAWMLPDMTSKEEGNLRDFLSGHLVPSGEGLHFDYDREVRWAVLWWGVGPRGKTR